MVGENEPWLRDGWVCESREPKPTPLVSHNACARRVESGYIYYACGITVTVGPDAYARHVAAHQPLALPANIILGEN